MHFRNHSLGAKKRARYERQEMSVSERVLWGFLRYKRLGFGFRRQYPVGPYLLDFYCPEAKLCVEVDGEMHLARQDRDEARDLYLSQLGIETLRIQTKELFEGCGKGRERALLEIIDACEERTGRPGNRDLAWLFG
jgi:very-short-patch-repair endonuclease